MNTRLCRSASLLLCLVPLSLPVGAGGPPTVAQVLAACDRGAAVGGVDSALCEWYTAPCGCKAGAVAADGSRWCLPAGEPIPAIVSQVVARLRQVPDQRAPAPGAVAEILVRLYPCANPQPRQLAPVGR